MTISVNIIEILRRMRKIKAAFTRTSDIQCMSRDFYDHLPPR